MRYGFTTGSCAAAAAKAAAYMLLSGMEKTEITIETPKGIPYTAQITDIQRIECAVTCAVIKDGGDDPDVTTGSRIVARVTLPEEQPDSGKKRTQAEVLIDGGTGVGRVTKPGLDQPVGNAAINHVPREMITKRVIHTTADFEYTDTLTFSEGAVGIARELLKKGADIVTDTNMALSGINKRSLAGLGGEVHCYMADETVAKLARERGTTRAAVSMEIAAKIQKPVIFAVGNAPTALIQIYEMMQGSDWRPAFVIGVPVGFVNVEAAKELILQTDVPFIINRGRKGGSNVAAAICNALIYELTRNRS